MTPLFFSSPSDFRKWLQRHHRSSRELWVGFYKKGTGRASITWPESVDEALCFGWIDGLRKRVDADSYMIRFTPRRAGSLWSAVNTRRMTELNRARRVRAAGLAAFKRRDGKTSGAAPPEHRTPSTGGGSSRASSTGEAAPFDRAVEERFRANRAAWTFFQAQPPGYRRMMTRMVMSAKQEATRLRRADILIATSGAARRLDPMKPLRR